MSGENPENSIDENIYHYDFTTASSWEIFIARIEELIYQWKLSTGKRKKSVPDSEFNKLDWKVQSEEVLFADTKFLLSYHRGESPVDTDERRDVDIIDEAMSIERDFAITPHVISFYYGLSEFVVLDPLNIYLSHSKLNTLTSAVTIAITNAQCEIPFFVRALDPKQNFYIGIACSQVNQMNFDMVDLKKVPQQCQHLTGLTHIFKTNLRKMCGKEVIISVRLSYELKNWTSFVWQREPPEINFSNNFISKEFTEFCVGCLFEPIASLNIRAVWSGLPEGSIVDGPGYSDLDPTHAPLWTLSISKMEDIACLLTDCLLDFTNLCSFVGSNHKLIGDLLARHSTPNYEKPLNSITESRIPKLGNLLFSDAMKLSFEEPIPKNCLLPILYYLFPDSDKTERHAYDSFTKTNAENIKYKTCKEDSLLWRLAVSTAHVLHSSYGGPRAAAHLWHEFTQELRFRWNTFSLIPGVAPGIPDNKTCLLHQKLQMINYCILVKTERDKLSTIGESEESDEEFYDCDSDEFDGKMSFWNAPAGRLEKHPTLKLLHSRNPLYIPKTQVPGPRTEDQQEEDDQAILSLEVSPQASETVAKMMSPLLLSEMESFKAANPGAVIEDFIRWFSPRDWIEKEDENGVVTGELSERMKVEGNTWLEVWQVAKPVPAHRQKRLFDEFREAERALHLVESAGPGEAASLLLPVLIHAALHCLDSQINEVNVNALTQAYDKIVKKAVSRTRINRVDISAYQDLITEIGMVECVLAQIRSLEFKFGVKCAEEDGRFIGDLLLGDSPEIPVPGGPGGPIAANIKSMFTEAYRVEQMLEKDSEEYRNTEFSHVIRPDIKEFVIRLRDADTAQRLTARLTSGRITMANLTTQPTILY